MTTSIYHKSKTEQGLGFAVAYDWGHDEDGNWVQSPYRWATPEDLMSSPDQMFAYFEGYALKTPTWEELTEAMSKNSDCNMKQEIMFWDGQGNLVSEMWDGNVFTSYVSNCGYISRYCDKETSENDKPVYDDQTGELCGLEYTRQFAEGDEFGITTDSGSMVIYDRVKVQNGQLLWLSTEQEY